MLAVGLMQLVALLVALLDAGTALALAAALPADAPPAAPGRLAVGALVALAVGWLLTTVGLARRARWARAAGVLLALAGAVDLPHGPLVALVALWALLGAGAPAVVTPPHLQPGYGLPRNAFAPPAPEAPPRAGPGLLLALALALATGAGAAWAGPGRVPAGDGLAARLDPLLDLRGLGWPAGALEALGARGPKAGAGGDAAPSLARPARAVPGLPGHYTYTDERGTTHITPDFESIPERFR